MPQTAKNIKPKTMNIMGDPVVDAPKTSASDSVGEGSSFPNGLSFLESEARFRLNLFFSELVGVGFFVGKTIDVGLGVAVGTVVGVFVGIGNGVSAGFGVLVAAGADVGGGAEFAEPSVVFVSLTKPPVPSGCLDQDLLVIVDE